MSEKPFIKFYPSDFLAGTSGLSPAERGVYITILCLIWEEDGPVAVDHGRLARRCGAPKATFQRALDALIAEGKIIETEQGLTNRRAEIALSDRQIRIENGSSAARARWSAHAEKTQQKQRGQDAVALPPNIRADTVMQCQPEPEPDIGGGGSAHARETDPPPRSEAATLREELLVAMGLDASGVNGPTGRIAGNMADMTEYRRWRNDLGLDHAAILEVIRETMAVKRDGPPSTFTYFTQPMRRAAAALAPKPILTPIEGGRRHDDDNQPARASRDPHARALGGMVEAFGHVIAAQPGGRGRDGDGG